MHTKIQYALSRARQLFRRISGETSELDKKRIDIEELHPATVHAGKVGLHIPEHLDRLTHVAFGGDLKQEVEQFLGENRPIPPTLRFKFNNIICDSRSIYDDFGYKKTLSLKKSKIFWNSPESDFDEVFLRSSFLGCQYFGHWLRDDCATHLLTQEQGCGRVVSAFYPDWIDTIPYMRAFGQELLIPDLWRATSVVCFDDVYQNEHKAARLLKLRHALRASYKNDSPAEIVYLKRGPTSAKREFINEDEIVDFLIGMGVYVMDCEAASLEDHLPYISGARLFIGVEGSQLSHALYSLADGGGLLVIQPPDRFFNSHMDWAWVTENPYGIIVGESAGELSFRVGIEEMLTMIDTMFAAID
jgi:hypothetical protein